MGSIGAIAVFIVISIVAIAVLRLKVPNGGGADNGLAFDNQEALFTVAERSFLGVLDQVMDDRYRVFGKVRLGDLVKPGKGLSNSKRTVAFNKLHQKHVDFVICTSSDLSVVGVVELDDKSHARSDRVSRDQFVDRALAAAKIPVVRIAAARGYVLADVKAKLVAGLALGMTAQTESSLQAAPAPVAQAEVPSEVVAAKTETPSVTPSMLVQNVSEVAAPLCPKCAATMVKRQAKNGPRAGEWFWACSQFPKCRCAVSIG